MGKMMETVLKHFGIFKIRKEERWPALVLLMLLLFLNFLCIHHYFDNFTLLRRSYRWIFIRDFHVSGFDPLTYITVSSWGLYYDVYRHPLLAFLMYVPYAANQLLMLITGMNCAQFVVAVILVFAGIYSFIFLYRIFREIIGLTRVDTLILSALNYSFAYVMISLMVPDHFGISMALLTFTVYIAGIQMKYGRQLKIWQTLLLFFATAGVSLNNGVKVFIAALFTNKRNFFTPKYFLLAVILPSIFIFAVAVLEDQLVIVPEGQVHLARQKHFQKKQDAKTAQRFRDTTSLKNPEAIEEGVRTLLGKQKRQRIVKAENSVSSRHTGEPMEHSGFLSWTDISTSRLQTAVENLFGESIQLHSRHLLEDVLDSRPVIVHYCHWWNYAVEGMIVFLFGLGIWSGRKNRLMWMALSFFAFDLFLHLGLGFGVNEIYIMSPHWLFIISIVIGCLFKVLKGRTRMAMRTLTSLIVTSLFIHNIMLIYTYLW